MIIYRDTTSVGGVRLPEWLDGCRDIIRIPHEGGDVLTKGEAFTTPDPAFVRWKTLSEGWQCAIVGRDPEHNRYLRQRDDIATAPVTDSKGRHWSVPIVLNPDGTCALPLAWGKDDSGVRVRKADEEQQRLMAVALSARGELKSDRLLQTPIDVLVSWVYPLLQSCYHISDGALDALGLCDDQLGIATLIAAMGYANRSTENH